MFEKLDLMRQRFAELNELIAKPEIVARQEEWQKLVKEHSTLAPIVEAYEKYLSYVEEMATCKEMMKADDKEMAEMAEVEYYDLRDKRDALEGEIKIMLLPKDPMDEKNVIIEIRGGAGGEEASLFANSLYRMYTM